MAPSIGNFPSNPFDHAFEMLGHVPGVTTRNVNAEALELLTQALTTRAGERGRMILLRSPRAGFGKTHLLMRLHQRVAHTHEFIPLEPSKGRYLDAQSVLDAVLRRFSRVLPAGGGLTVLDLLARRILATGLEPLVKSGEVPSQDRDSALQALQMRPVETFDFHNEEAVTARWAMTNFSLLGPRLTAELAERTHAGYRPVAWWVELLFRYSSAPIDQTSRNSSLFETVFGADRVETDMHEKLVTLLNMTGLVTSPVLILDEVEGFSSNPEAALQVATFLNALHQSCSKLALIISVNGDVWETAFLPRIPCGLKDRLSDIVVDLKPMDRDTAVALLRDRAGDQADAIADTMDFDTGVVYARGLIRQASAAWEGLMAEKAATFSEDEGVQDPISLRVEEPAEQADASQHQPDPGRELHAPAAVVVPTAGYDPALFHPEPSEPSASEREIDELAAGEPAMLVEPSAEDLQSPEPPEPSITPDEASAIGSVFSILSDEADRPLHEEAPVFEPEAVGQPDPRPYVSPDLPQPFAQHQPQQAVEPSQEPQFWHPQSPPVIESPFAIDTSATPTPSPFQPAQPVQESPYQDPNQANQPVQPGYQGPPAQPMQASPQGPPPHPATGHAPQVPADSPFRVDDGKTPPHQVTQNDHEKVEDLLKQFRDRYGRE
ncbi:MAG: hypothetical protein H7A51_06050 [Akkermansiaceae bacterium]|nr:hypothetical protein [Akkermansiaceae bacterium]